MFKFFTDKRWHLWSIGGTILILAATWYQVQLDVRINDSVYIEKGGEIIPKVTKVEISERVLDTGKFKFINSCPACDTELKTIEDQAVHYCPNYKKCPPQVSGRIEHFISKNAMNIEFLGPETVKGLSLIHI